MEKKELNEQQIKYLQENNNMILDLIVKNTKSTTVLNMLLDYVNFNQELDPVLDPKEYAILQDLTIKQIELLTKIYTKFVDKIREENANNEK